MGVAARSNAVVEQLLEDPGWFRALTLRERRGPAGGADVALSERHVRLWSETRPFGGIPKSFEAAALHGCSTGQFAEVLGLTADTLARRGLLPAWLRALRKDVADGSPLTPSGIPIDGFEKLIGPWLVSAGDQVSSIAKELARTDRAPFDESVADLLLHAGAGYLLRMLVQPLSVELHAARLEGRLAGDTPEQRFDSFIALLDDPGERLAILLRYPVVARQAIVYLDNWVDASCEFLARLAHDWADVTNAFGLAADDRLVDASQAGDRHRGGRTVLVAAFSSGRRVVYKPRPMSGERHFQELLRWLDERTGLPTLGGISIRDRGAYGWAEYVANDPCSSAAEGRRFYQRQGAYVALLYALGAVDFHAGNLLAVGERPILVDLETVLHGVAAGEPWGEDLHPAEVAVLDAMADSVLRTGLLPKQMFGDGETRGIDVSGLAADAGQQGPLHSPVWERAGTDEMRQVFKRLPTSPEQNRAVLDGQPLTARDFVADILDGFDEMAATLYRHRDELLDEGGRFTAFAHDDTRFLLRPTVAYAYVLDSSYHPHFLSDALERERRFDRLLATNGGWQHHDAIATAERDDLWRDDIPLFVSRPLSRHLWTSSGACVENFLEQAPLEAARSRLDNLHGAALEHQRWLLRGSILTTALNSDGYRPDLWLDRPGRRPPTPPDRLIAAARRIGERLEQLAVRRGDGASWAGFSSQRGDDWSMVPLDFDLYGGLSGIALFLAHLGGILEEERYSDLARRALATSRAQIERATPETGIGAFTGVASYTYALIHLASLWCDPFLLDEAVGTLPALEIRIDTDDRFDVIAGVAGVIPLLLALEAAGRGAGARPLAERCGAHLIANATRVDGGLGWIARDLDRVPLTGFAHGAAGVAWSLLQLAAATHDERFRNAAAGALRYERSQFDPSEGNWRDLRSDESSGFLSVDTEGQRHMTHWCHGASGIGLARVHSLPYCDDDETRAEIAAAATATLVTGMGLNHSLCHGDLGNIEFLHEAARALDEPSWAAAAAAWTSSVADAVLRSDWRCGYPSWLESPSLMMGLAGIGYGLLRRADPDRVPSVLTLAPPFV
jgi:type 2 lantibiotic biosynthesis protein LanM